MDSIPFRKEGYSLVRTYDLGYVLECMEDTILTSVTETERTLSELWIKDILSVISENFKNGVMDNEAFVLKKDDEECGLLWLGRSRDQFTCEETGYLLGIFVKKEMRRMGLGELLMGAAECWCKTNGLITMTLNVGAPNDAANALYKKMGYEPQTTIMRKLFV